MIISLLRSVDNPMQDIPLLAVMMSPIYGFTPMSLRQLKSRAIKSKAPSTLQLLIQIRKKLRAF